MALSHVERTGNPSAAWKYLTKAATMGRSYALYTTNVSCLSFLVILGRFDFPGYRAIGQSQGPVYSYQPVSTAVPCFSRTMTASRVKVIDQSVSHKGPTPINVRQKPGHRCPLVVKSDGRWGKAKLPVPTDCCVCPVAVTTVTLVATRSMLTTGASAAKYMPVVKDSTMPVALVWSARWRSVWVYSAVTLLMSSKGEGFLSRLVIKLSV